MNTTIAIQSWCFREFKPLASFLTQLKACGVSATELCAVHADFSNPATHADVIRQCKDAGVQLASIGVEYLSGDPAKDRPRFEFCKLAGIREMSISFAPEAMWDGVKAIEKLADEYDMKLGIHNHGGYDWLGNDRILSYIFSKTSKRIGLHMDTAWALDARQDPIKWVEKFGDRLYGVHFKDFVFDRARNGEDVIIGQGNLKLPELIGALRKIDFTGPLVIEYERDVKNPVPALTQCVAELKKLL